MMSGEEFDEILKEIEIRRVYVKKYQQQFNITPQWLDKDNSNKPDFEEWMKAEIRNEK